MFWAVLSAAFASIAGLAVSEGHWLIGLVAFAAAALILFTIMKGKLI